MPKRPHPRQETVRTNLRRFREELNLTLPQAALETGVPIESLKKYETGTHGVDFVRLADIATAYGRGVEEFLMDDPPPARPDNRPVVFVRWRADVEPDPESIEQIQKVVADVSRRHREAKSRRGKK